MKYTCPNKTVLNFSCYINVAFYVAGLAVYTIDTYLYIRRKSQIGSTFRERAKLVVHSEKELNWLSIWRRSQHICQFKEYANFLKTKAFSQMSFHPPAKPVPFLHKPAFISWSFAHICRLLQQKQ